MWRRASRNVANAAVDVARGRRRSRRTRRRTVHRVLDLLQVTENRAESRRRTARYREPDLLMNAMLPVAWIGWRGNQALDVGSDAVAGDCRPTAGMAVTGCESP